MATLQEIGMSGIAGTAPTPVCKVAINKYLVNDDLLNLMQFVNIGMGTNIGNVQASFVYYDGASEATFRALGQKYTPDNATPLTETVALKPMGGSFEVDNVNVRAFGTQAGAIANFVEQQTGQKLNAIKNGYTKYFMQGNSTTDAKQFDGLNKKIVASQVVNSAISVDELTEAKALQVEVALNKVIAKIRPKRPNVIATTADGKAILSALNAYRHRGVEAIEVNGKKYDQYMGIPIVVCTDDCFSGEDKAIGIPVVFMLIDEFEGVRTAIPNDGQVVVVLPPRFENGQVVETGSCEMLCAPLFANPFAIAKCYLSEVGE